MTATVAERSRAEIAALTEGVNLTHAIVTAAKERDRSLRIGYSLCAGGILNAYREGDLTFDEAVDEIEKVGEQRRTASKSLSPAAMGDSELAEILQVESSLREQISRLETELQRAKDELAGCGQRALGLREGFESVQAANERLRAEVQRLRGERDGKERSGR